MAEPTIQLGGGNWAGKSDNLLGYYKEGERFYKQDFTFSRSTSGTRVNSSGLIETAQIVSTSEEVTNGNFATNSDWTIESTWTISGGAANGNGASGSTQELKQTSVNTIGKIYKATFEVLNYVSGTVGFWQGSGISVIPRSANGTYTEYFTATSTEIRFRGTNFYGSIDNVSVKEVFQVNIPRVDYLNNSNGSLILEPQRSNLVTYSESLISSPWFSGTGTENADVSPDGTQSATLITNDLTRQNISVTIQSYTVSVFIKGGNFKLELGSVFGSQSFVIFNISTETFTSVGTSVNNYGFYKYTNGWYRIYLTATPSSIGIGQVQLKPEIPILGMLMWGAQLEQGSYATSYIPTSGSTVTRNADVCSITNVADRIGQTEGTLFLDIDFINTGGLQILLSAHDGASNKRLEIWANGLEVNGFIGGSVNIAIGNTTISEGRHKLALAYNQSGDQAFYVDGVQIGTSNTVYTIAALTELSYGIFSGNTDYAANGNIYNTKIYNTRLSNSELATLTTL